MTVEPHKKPRVWVVFKRWLLYIPIALLLIAVMEGGFAYATHIGIEDILAVKLMSILLTALFVFGYAIKHFWKYHQRVFLWVELGVLLIAHFAILQRLNWREANYPWLIVVVGIPEMFVVFVLLSVALRENTPAKK
jgi:hypothetical protein